MHSTFSQASACWRISLPRAPGPMMPRRIRWFAPRALRAANVPARPVATRPMKLRRDCMGIGLLGRNPIIYGRDAGAEASGETGSRAHQAEHMGGRGRVRRWGGTGLVPVVMLDLALERLLLRSVRVLAVGRVRAVAELLARQESVGPVLRTCGQPIGPSQRRQFHPRSHSVVGGERTTRQGRWRDGLSPLAKAPPLRATGSGKHDQKPGRVSHASIRLSIVPLRLIGIVVLLRLRILLLIGIVVLPRLRILLLIGIVVLLRLRILLLIGSVVLLRLRILLLIGIVVLLRWWILLLIGSVVLLRLRILLLIGSVVLLRLRIL